MNQMGNPVAAAVAAHRFTNDLREMWNLVFIVMQ
jgi:hypothetical protein